MTALPISAQDPSTDSSANALITLAMVSDGNSVVITIHYDISVRWHADEPRYVAW